MESNKIIEEIMQDIKEHLLPVVDNGANGNVHHYNRVWEKIERWRDKHECVYETGSYGEFIQRQKREGRHEVIPGVWIDRESKPVVINKGISSVKSWIDDQDPLEDSSGLYDSIMNAVSPSFDVICVPIGLLKGIPCDHPGCIAHRKDPCEVCGRINAGLND